MPDLTTSVAEPLAAKDSYLGAGFTDFANRVNAKESSETTTPVKDAEPGTADTSKEAKPEEKSKSAAEPGAATKQEPEKKDKLSAEERISQLAREKNVETEARQRAEKRAQELEERIKAPKPETVKAEALPEDPDPFTWAGTPEEFKAAKAKYQAHHDQQLIAQVEARQRQAVTDAALQSQLDEAGKKYPDAKEKIISVIAKIHLDQKIPFEVKGILGSSPVLGDLLYVLGDDKTLANFTEMARSNPREALALMYQLERDIKAETSKPTEKTEKPAPAKPEPKAPEPPKEVGGRGTTPTDELEASVRDDDYRRSKAAMANRYFAAS